MGKSLAVLGLILASACACAQKPQAQVLAVWTSRDLREVFQACQSVLENDEVCACATGLLRKLPGPSEVTADLTKKAVDACIPDVDQDNQFEAWGKARPPV